MPKRDATPAGAPCWVDLMTSDPDKTRAFYGELFGWTGDEGAAEFGGYINLSKDGMAVAGCMPSHGMQGPSDVWCVYLATEDAEKSVERAVAHGGSVMVAPMKVSDAGTMAYVTDAGDAAIGIWQPGTHKGFGVTGEPGAASWFELATRDFDASVKFYEDVFGWDTHPAFDGPDMRYTTFGKGETALAGIMDASAFLPEEVPAHWSVYFDAVDADAAVAKVVALGGSVVRPPDDTPYGRLAHVADVNGAHFKIRGTG